MKCANALFVLLSSSILTRISAYSATAVDPWLLSHGVIFILNYSILMPVAAFLVLFERERFYQIHNVLGVMITVLLVAGWACLAGAASDKANGFVYSGMSDSPVAMTHSVTGIIARFVAVVVCIIGVILGVVRMPKRVRLVVRLSHGVMGVGIALFGPLVVWNGWVRLQPFIPPVVALDSTPIVWFTTLIVITGFYIWNRAFTILRHSKAKSAGALSEPRDIEKSIPVLTVPDVIEMIKTARDALFFFYENQVIRIDDVKLIDHPGGIDVLMGLNGKDITGIMAGTESFPDQGRQRFLPHSSTAIQRMLEYRVGQLAGPGIPMIPDNSTVIDGTIIGLIDDINAATGTFSIDEEGKSVGIITNIELLNQSEKFPVKRFIMRVMDPIFLFRASAGMKVRLSLSLDDPDAIERTYTIVSINQGMMELIIKIYPNGALTSQLDVIAESQPLFLAKLAPGPKIQCDCDFIIFLAGGTGIVPLLSYFENTDKPAHVVWSVRKREDLFLIEELNHVVNTKTDKLEITITVTGETEIHAPAIGLADSIRIKFGRTTIEELCEIKGSHENLCAVMSGPRNFVMGMHDSLVSIGVDGSNIISLD
jgi:ferredoxin-NADP reductase